MGAKKKVSKMLIIDGYAICPSCNIKKKLEEFNFYRSGPREGKPIAKCISCARSKKLKERYNITEDEYNSLLKLQNYRCAICFTDKPGGDKEIKRFVIDHNHETNKVRGLLCYPCNMALGLLKDSLLHLKSAQIYLEKYN